jgi:HNH endonuclease
METLDHFIPFAMGGGTTVDNCVPACSYCNYTKNSYDPDDYGALLLTNNHHYNIKTIERVRSYLSGKKNYERLPCLEYLLMVVKRLAHSIVLTIQAVLSLALLF